MNHESAFDNAGLEPRCILQHSGDLDLDQVRIAQEWILAGRPFAGLVTCRKTQEQQATPDPFRPYPIVYLKRSR